MVVSSGRERSPADQGFNLPCCLPPKTLVSRKWVGPRGVKEEAPRPGFYVVPVNIILPLRVRIQVQQMPNLPGVYLTGGSPEPNLTGGSL
jgi:hypothetical protein